MVAAKFTIEVEQGEDYSKVFTYLNSSGTAVDLSGYSARMRVRDRTTSGPYTLERTTEDGGITLGDTAGTIKITIPSIVTARLPAPYRGVYDIELISSGGLVVKPFRGLFRVYPEVTR